MLDILYNMSHSDHYEDEYDRLLAKGKNPNEMLADEVIAHAVARMVTNGEAALDEITNNEIIKAVVRRAYNFRENERQREVFVPVRLTSGTIMRFRVPLEIAELKMKLQREDKSLTDTKALTKAKQILDAQRAEE